MYGLSLEVHRAIRFRSFDPAWAKELEGFCPIVFTGLCFQTSFLGFFCMFLFMKTLRVLVFVDNNKLEYSQIQRAVLNVPLKGCIKVQGGVLFGSELVLPVVSYTMLLDRICCSA